MKTSNQRLCYSFVRGRYLAAFGEKPPAALLKSVSLVDGGTQDLAKAMMSAVKAGKPMNFNVFSKQFFDHLAGNSTGHKSISQESATD